MDSAFYIKHFSQNVKYFINYYWSNDPGSVRAG